MASRFSKCQKTSGEYPVLFEWTDGIGLHQKVLESYNVMHSLVAPKGAGEDLTRYSELLGGRALLALALGEQGLVDVGQHATGGDGDAAEILRELLIVADGELHVARNDARALVVASGVARQLKHLSLRWWRHRP